VDDRGASLPFSLVYRSLHGGSYYSQKAHRSAAGVVDGYVAEEWRSGAGASRQFNAPAIKSNVAPYYIDNSGLFAREEYQMYYSV